MERIWNEILKSETPDPVLLEKLRNVIRLRNDNSLFRNDDFHKKLNLGLDNIKLLSDQMLQQHSLFQSKHENGPLTDRFSAAEEEKLDFTHGAVASDQQSWVDEQLTENPFSIPDLDVMNLIL